MKKINEEEFRKVCEESPTMAIAAAKLDLHFNTFKRYATKLGLYSPNQGGKGTSKDSNKDRKIDVYEILAGKHPEFQTFKLKNKLIKEGILQNICSICGITEWCEKKLNCELDHINGTRTDHRLENLRMLCPNCHSQTETFRSKNRKNSLT